MPWLTGLPPSLLTPPRSLVEVQHLGLVLMSWNPWRLSRGCWNCSFTVTASLSLTRTLPLKAPFGRPLCVWDVALAHPELQLCVLLVVFWERTQWTLQTDEVTVTECLGFPGRGQVPWALIRDVPAGMYCLTVWRREDDARVMLLPGLMSPINSGFSL